MVDSVYGAAAKAYSNASKMLGTAKPAGGDEAATIGLGPSAVKDPSKLSFSDLVEGSIDRSIATTYKSEEVGIKTMLNKADLHEMVAAVTQAELTLQSVVAVRDRVINAYQDILKMPI